MCYGKPSALRHRIPYFKYWLGVLYAIMFHFVLILAQEQLFAMRPKKDRQTITPMYCRAWSYQHWTTHLGVGNAVMMFLVRDFCFHIFLPMMWNVPRQYAQKKSNKPKSDNRFNCHFRHLLFLRFTPKDNITINIKTRNMAVGHPILLSTRPPTIAAIIEVQSVWKWNHGKGWNQLLVRNFLEHSLVEELGTLYQYPQSA